MWLHAYLGMVSWAERLRKCLDVEKQIVGPGSIYQYTQLILDNEKQAIDMRRQFVTLCLDGNTT